MIKNRYGIQNEHETYFDTTLSGYHYCEKQHYGYFTHPLKKNLTPVEHK